MKLFSVAFFGLILSSIVSPQAAAATLDDVRARGFVQCGVTQAQPGFSLKHANGQWSGFDVDFCRAIAAAIFDDPEKVKFAAVAPEGRLVAIRRGSVDVLIGDTAWTMGREVELAMRFPAINYYRGLGFLVPKELGIGSALELTGGTICVQSGPDAERRARDYFSARKMTVEFVAPDPAADAAAAYETGQCNVCMAPKARLHAKRLGLSAPDDHLILPEVASQEPLGPAVRFGDEEWFDIVRWVVFATIIAEERGISSKTLDDALTSDQPAIRRFLGAEGVYGKKLGLEPDWAVRIVRHIGNYAEIYDRNLGAASAMKMDRGLNALWRNGGLLYAPPVR